MKPGVTLLDKFPTGADLGGLECEDIDCFGEIDCIGSSIDCVALLNDGSEVRGCERV